MATHPTSQSIRDALPDTTPLLRVTERLVTRENVANLLHR